MIADAVVILVSSGRGLTSGKVYKTKPLAMLPTVYHFDS